MASSIDAIPTKALETLLECSVCLETLNDPRTLSCFHSFCRCCLEKFVQGCRDRNENPQLNTFECPVCRSEFTVNPQKGVKGIRTNHFVHNMLDVMAVESRVKGIPCHHCQKASAGRCVHSKCQCFLCEGCIQAHNNYLGNRDHSVLLMDELSKPENRSKIRGNPFCKEHEGEILKFFCETCEELVCQDCKVDNHEDHKCSSLKKAADEKTDELKKWCATLSDELNESNEALQTMNNVVKVLDDNVKAAKDKIRERKNGILAAVGRMLEEKETSLTDKIDEMYRVKSETMNKQLGEGQVYANKVKNSMDLCKSLLENGDAVEIVSSHRMVLMNIEITEKDQPEDWKPVNDGSIPFNQSGMEAMDVEMAKLSKRLGEIEGKNSNDCPICQSAMTNPKVLPRCGHVFCKLCIDKAFTYQMKCPICQEVYGITEGNQPDGTMSAHRSNHGNLSGYEGCGYYTITYDIPSGKQDKRHPNPGSWFTGTVRHAYLPASKEGEVVLKLLQNAFEKKLIFTVGRSTSSIGIENRLTWNGIHHKTSMTGGPQRSGYPDPDYLRRVTEELKAKGIVPE